MSHKVMGHIADAKWILSSAVQPVIQFIQVLDILLHRHVVMQFCGAGKINLI